MIHLDCPNCEEKLELDEGFRGGVCRCFGCGTMMTVPAESDGVAETLTLRQRSARPDRPDRPDAPSRAESPTASTATSPSDSMMASTTRFVTASGRTIKISQDMLDRVPTAQRARVGVRVGVILAFAAVTLLLGGAIAGIGVALSRGPSPEPPPIVIPPANGGNGGEKPNPFRADEATLAGLPMAMASGESVVVVIDCSGQMAESFDAVRDLVRANLLGWGDRTTVQLVLTSEHGQTVFPSRPSPPVRWNRSALARTLSGALAGGANAVAPGVDAALDTFSQRVVLVAADAPSAETIAGLTDKARDRGAIIDVVQVGGEPKALADLAASARGRYLWVDPADLARWYRQYLARP